MSLDPAKVGIEQLTPRGYNDPQSPNSTAHRWGDIVSRKIASVTYQAYAFVTHDAQYHIAFRTLPVTGPWKVHATGITISTADDHRNTTLGIDSDGYLHLCANHHGDPLVYQRSAAPLSSWTGAWSVGLSMLGTNEDLVTYPAFFISPIGTLYFTFRNRSSGAGNTYIYEYDEATTSWSAIAGSGANGLVLDGLSTSPDYSFYAYEPPTFTPDWDGAGTGYLHLCYTKRRTTGLDNSDLYHLRWDGTNFFKTDATPQTIPATANNLTTAVVIAEPELLLNSGGFCLDAAGHPHIAYWKSDGARYQLYHTHHNGTAWATIALTNYAAGVVDHTDVGRPAMRCDLATNSVYVWYTCPTQEGPGIFEQASGASDFASWTRRLFFNADVDSYEPTVDVAQWDAHGLACMFITLGQNNSGSIVGHAPVLLTRQPAAVTADTFEAANWPGQHDLTVDHTRVGAGGVTSYTLLLTREHFADQVCSPTDSARAQADGSDLRAFADLALTTRLAVDVIAFEYDSAHGAKDAQIEVRVGPINLSDLTDTVIQLKYGNPIAQLPWVDEPYGARNAYDSHWLRYLPIYPHIGCRITPESFWTFGNGVYTEPTYSDGLAQFSPGNNLFIRYGSQGISNAFWIAAELRVPPTQAGIAQIVAADDSVTPKSRNLQFRIENGLLQLIRFDAAETVATFIEGVTNLSGVPSRVVGAFSTVNGSSMYVNGGAEGSHPGTLANADRLDALWGIGWRNSDGENDPYTGLMGRVEIHAIDRGEAWAVTDSNNVLNPSTFAVPGTPINGNAPHDMVASDPEAHADPDSGVITQTHNPAGVDPTAHADADVAGITQAHDMAAADIEGRADPDSGSVGQQGTLQASDPEAHADPDSAAVGQAHDMAAVDPEAIADPDSGAVSQDGTLQAIDPEAHADPDSGAVGQAHDMVASDPEGHADPDTGIVDGSATLIAVDPEALADPDSAGVTIIHKAVAADPEGKAAMDALGVSQAHNMQAANPEARADVSAVALLLDGIGLVFNPRTIDVGLRTYLIDPNNPTGAPR